MIGKPLSDCHALGMRTTATMMFGLRRGKSPLRQSFERLRRISGRYGRIHRLYPVDFRAGKPRRWKENPETTAFDLLKTLAISRMYLDNIDHVQSSWLTPGIKILPGGSAIRGRRLGSILIRRKRSLRRRGSAIAPTRTNFAASFPTRAIFLPSAITLYRSYALKQAS